MGGLTVRRLAIGLAVMLAAVLAFSGTATAAPAQTSHFHFNGSFAEALWFTSTSTSSTDTYINSSRRLSGQMELFVDQFTQNYDTNGNFTGATETSADVTSGFSFTIDNGRLSTASVSGTGLPAQTCTYDADFNLVGCSDTTIDASANWTGEGNIFRGESNDHFHTFGFTLSEHFSGSSRSATATGTIGGLALGTGDLAFADLGKVNAGSVTICMGSSC